MMSTKRARSGGTVNTKKIAIAPSYDKSPYWDDDKTKISKHLWIPKINDGLTVSERILLNSKFPIQNKTWFSTQTEYNRKVVSENKLSSTYIDSFWPSSKGINPEPMPFVEVGNNVIIPSKQKLDPHFRIVKLKLFIRNQKDKETLNRYFGIYRWTYNQAVSLLKDEEIHKEKKLIIDPDSSKPITWLKFLRQRVINNRDSQLVKDNPWTRELISDIRAEAMHEALKGYVINLKMLQDKKIKHFELHYRKKKCKSESITLRKLWLDLSKKNVVSIKWPIERTKPQKKLPPMKFFVPNGASNNIQISHSCKLHRTNMNEYYLLVPVTVEPKTVDTQDRHTLRICSLDPGVRTFQTIYDATANKVTYVGRQDIQRIRRLGYRYDKLQSQQSKEKSRMRYRLKRVMRRINKRIRNLVDEMHKQLAKYLVTNYDLIMLPLFSVKQMTVKIGRNINSTTARGMITLSHFRFKQRLIDKARQFRKKIAIVDESYTTKTCSSCGHMRKIKNAKTYKCLYCKQSFERDANGAKNIFLKNYQALGIHLQ